MFPKPEDYESPYSMMARHERTHSSDEFSISRARYLSKMTKVSIKIKITLSSIPA